MKSFVGILLLLSVSVALGADSSVVQTSSGPVQGLVGPTSRSFKGIPYAAPPTGDLRWAAPTEPTSWGAIRDATSFSAGCPQRCLDTLPGHCPETMDEDCLALNVYTPLVEESDPLLPVMVWIHGGRYQFGTAMAPAFDGTNFVSEGNVIMVSINYRLGVLGFMYDGGDFTGNYGFYDQQYALRWVQMNIKNFGGDPSRVTIFGQSAGGMSVASHLVSPSSEGLFQAAILESHPFAIPFKDKNFAKEVAANFRIEGQCQSRSCFWGMNTTHLLDIQTTIENHIFILHPLQSFVPFSPVVIPGSRDLPLQPFDAFMHGNYSKVPVLAGSNADDSLIFIYIAAKNPVNTVAYLAATSLLFKGKSIKVDKMYKPQLFAGDQRPVISQLGTDLIFKCASRTALKAMSNGGNENVFLYEYKHAISYGGWEKNFTACDGFACHSAELPFLFNPPNYNTKFSAAEVTLSKQLNNYWTNFATTFNPSKGPHPVSTQWPAFNNATRTWMNLDTPANTITQNEYSKQCSFWDSIGYKSGW